MCQWKASILCCLLEYFTWKRLITVPSLIYFISFSIWFTRELRWSLPFCVSLFVSVCPSLSLFVSPENCVETLQNCFITVRYHLSFHSPFSSENEVPKYSCKNRNFMKEKLPRNSISQRTSLVAYSLTHKF